MEEHKNAVEKRGALLEQEIDEKQALSNESVVNEVFTLKIKSRPYIGAQSLPLGEQDLLPALFSKKVNYGFPGRANLRTIAERITKIYGMPVRIKPDVFAVTAPAPNGPTGQAESLPPLVTPLSRSPIATFSSNVAEDVEITDFYGPFPDLLNLIATRLGIYWEYQKESIVFYRYTTKTFVIHAAPGDATFNTSVGKAGSTNGSNFSSTGQVTSNSSWSVWNGLKETLSRILRPDRFYVSEAQGTVTITDTPDVVDMVEKIIDRSNSLGGRQVAVRMELISLSRKDDNETGLDWNVIFQKLENLVPQWSISMASPATLTSVGAGSIGSAILAPVVGDNSVTQKLTGTQAMVRLLKQFGNVNTNRSVGTVTMNRTSAPLAITNQISYLARTTPGSSTTGGSSSLPGLEPGILTTGFVANVLPTILDNNAILLKVSVDSSELQKIGIVSTGQGATLQSIQTPEISSVTAVNVATLQSGQSLVLTGFELERAKYDQNGITDTIGLGGSYVGTRQRDKVILIITPTVVGGV